MKIISVVSRSRLEPPFFAWSRSRPNLVGAEVGSGTFDFRSWRRPKKWRLRNTVFNSIRIYTVCEASYRYIGTGNLISTGNIKTVILKYHTGNTIYR